MMQIMPAREDFRSSHGSGACPELESNGRRQKSASGLSELSLYEQKPEGGLLSDL
jgi:hypothetical protein